MAVRHGFGKVVTDGLIFAYDTKDIWNSYKGEPTDNLISLAGHDSEVERSGTNYPYFSANITSFVQSIWSPSNNVFTMSFEGKRDYVQGGTGGGGDGYPRMYVYFSDWSWSRSFGTGAYDWTYTSSTGAMPDPTGKNIYFAIYHMNSGNPGKSYSRKHQVEFKGHATPFINGSRSSTEGLLDLTGSRSIYLDYVSFDSNADIDFDGTTDFVPINVVDDVYNSDYSVEVVFKRDVSGVQHGLITDYQYGWWRLKVLSDNRIYWNHKLNDSNVNSLYSTATVGTEWNHVAVTFSKTDGAKMYLNGVLTANNTDTRAFGLVSGRGPQYIGYERPGAPGSPTAWFNGKIPIVKIYNKTLSSFEITQNFNHYKTRYSL